VGYGPIQFPADLVTVSHEHEDHNWTEGIPGNPVVVKGGERELKGVKLRTLSTFHDGSKGKERGPNKIFVLELDGLRVCHLGDLGHPLSPEDRARIGPVDVLLIPIGGFYTIDAQTAWEIAKELNPKVIVPMHYRTERCGFPIASVDEFLKGKERVKRIGSTEIELTPDLLPAQPEVWVLEHAL
jgi:L-ascorbate metabolism protein UlaG (beta-lactamase superfamily)